MNGMYIATIIMTIIMIWVLLVSYQYAYKRKWGNENSSVDALPNIDNQHHDELSKDTGEDAGAVTGTDTTR